MIIHEAAIRERLRSDVAAAWPEVTRIYDEAPRVWPPAEALPWASIASEGVEKTYGGAGLRYEWQYYRYNVYGIWSERGIDNPEAFRAERADALVRKLREAGTPYAGVGVLLRITRTGPGPELEREEPLLAVNVALEVAVVEEV